MYYRDGLGQAEIAKRLGVHHSTISRALRQALEEGIVDVRITEPLPEGAAIESRLLHALPLRGATVSASQRKEALTGVAASASDAISRLLVRGETVAVGWGMTMVAVARACRGRAASGAAVAEAVGHVLWEGSSAGEASRLLATSTGADYFPMSAPGYASPEMAEELLRSDTLASCLKTARESSGIFVSTGTVSDDSPFVGTALKDVNEMRQMRQKGAVGEILGHYIDVDGSPVSCPYFTPIGLTLNDLSAAESVYGVVCGPHKAQVTVAAIRGGYIHHLVTDVATAESLLALALT